MQSTIHPKLIHICTHQPAVNQDMFEAWGSLNDIEISSIKVPVANGFKHLTRRDVYI